MFLIRCQSFHVSRKNRPKCGERSERKTNKLSERMKNVHDLPNLNDVPALPCTNAPTHRRTRNTRHTFAHTFPSGSWTTFWQSGSVDRCQHLVGNGWNNVSYGRMNSNQSYGGSYCTVGANREARGLSSRQTFLACLNFLPYLLRCYELALFPRPFPSSFYGYEKHFSRHTEYTMYTV